MRCLLLMIGLSIVPLGANAACTDFVMIKDLLPRSGGWTHVVAEGLNNMDLSQCGTNNQDGLLINFNDSTGTEQGKKTLLSILLSAYAMGKLVKLCSTGCDTQWNAYSRLDSINGLQ